LIPTPDWLDWATEARPAPAEGQWIARWRLIGPDRWRIGLVDRWSVLEFV
jgi:hypothetical protein